MPEKKIYGEKLADLLFLRAVGYTNSEIAKKLEISVSTVEYHLKKLKKEAKETTPQLVVARIILEAGPAYIFRFTPLKFGLDEIFEGFEGKRKKR